MLVSRKTSDLIRSGGMKKGDVLAVAQTPDIMGAKRTPNLIPMCHPVQIGGTGLSLILDETRCYVDIRAAVSCDGRTGVALTAASAAALTVYDMCKAVQKDILISDIRLLKKPAVFTEIFTGRRARHERYSGSHYHQRQGFSW